MVVFVGHSVAGRRIVVVVGDMWGVRQSRALNESGTVYNRVCYWEYPEL